MHYVFWIVAGLTILVALVILGAALPSRKKITPQEWADELENHLLGTEGPWDWDDATSIGLADERFENLRRRLADFDLLDTPEKKDQLRQIIEALRNGEVP